MSALGTSAIGKTNQLQNFLCFSVKTWEQKKINLGIFKVVWKHADINMARQLPLFRILKLCKTFHNTSDTTNVFGHTWKTNLDVINGIQNGFVSGKMVETWCLDFNKVGMQKILWNFHFFCIARLSRSRYFCQQNLLWKNFFIIIKNEQEFKKWLNYLKTVSGKTPDVFSKNAYLYSMAKNLY